MTKPTDGDFDRLLGEASQHDARRQALRSKQAEYKGFLAEHGVTLDDAAKIGIVMLAGAKISIDIALQETDDPEPLLLIKKRLQAHYKLRGFDDSWLELIDAELPGPALQDSDVDALAEQFSYEINIEETIIKEYEDKAVEMLQTIGHDATDELSENQVRALDELLYLEASSLRPPDKLERAREILLDTGLLDEWRPLLDKFFPI